MASTSVDLERDENDGFCAALESALAAAGIAGLDERIQRDAIVRLRAGATANPGLLPLLATGRYAPVPPRTARTTWCGVLWPYRICSACSRRRA
jgi:hypothetical protein